MSAAELSTTDDCRDLHFTDRLALVAHDLRQVSLWLEEVRTDWEDAGLPEPLIRNGEGDRVQLNIICGTAERLDAAEQILCSDGRLSEVRWGRSVHCIYVERTFGLVTIWAYRLRDDYESPVRSVA